MADAVASTFTPTQLEVYGNIILNGYATAGANTTNKKAWQYKETTTPPVDLPSLTSYVPAMKGWTTNYVEYYTQLPPNAYGVNPGDPTMFEYTVHSFTTSGVSKWAQPPHRYYAATYSFVYPVADSQTEPPIGGI